MIRNFQLQDLVKEAINRPVVWGEDDCLLFAADASLLQTGRDPMPMWRGKWSSKREAYLLIAQLGNDFASAVERCAAEIGHPRIAAADAAVGDMGILIIGGVQSMACRIEQGWLARRERGVHVSPTADTAWRVA